MPGFGKCVGDSLTTSFADDQDDESPAFPPPTDVPEGDGMPFLPPPERDKAATSVPEGAP